MFIETTANTNIHVPVVQLIDWLNDITGLAIPRDSKVSAVVDIDLNGKPIVCLNFEYSNAFKEQT